MVSADFVRSLKGRPAVVRLTSAGGGGSVRGTISQCLESADGLVVFVVDEGGRSHTIHYQHIAELEPLESSPEA